MKSFNHLWENMIDPINVDLCIEKAARGKKKRKTVQYVLRKKESVRNQLVGMLEAETIKTVQNEKVFIKEGSKNKLRIIEKPHFKYEQIIHHLLLSQLAPIIERSQYKHSYACIPGRGVHKAKRQMEMWVKSYKGQKLYIAELDIKQSYQNVDLDLLYGMYDKKIRDVKFLRLIERNLYGRYEPTPDQKKEREGLPLGSCTSPWHFNFYLQGLDYFILQELKPDHYLRYADNMFLFSRNKRALHRMVLAIGDFLDKKLHMKLKDDWQVYRFEYFDKKTGKVRGRAINALGFVIHHNRVTLRKSILYKIRKRINKVNRKVKRGGEINFKNAAGILSSLGWIRHAQCYNYYKKYLKKKINKKVLKDIVREHQREEERKKWQSGRRYRTAGQTSQKRLTPNPQST